MQSFDTTPALLAETRLLAVISHPDVNLDEVVAIGIDLGKNLRACDQQDRTLFLARLRSKAEEARAAGEITDAILIELVLRSLQRFVRY